MFSDLKNHKLFEFWVKFFGYAFPIEHWPKNGNYPEKVGKSVYDIWWGRILKASQECAWPSHRGHGDSHLFRINFRRIWYCIGGNRRGYQKSIFSVNQLYIFPFVEPIPRLWECSILTAENGWRKYAPHLHASNKFESNKRRGSYLSLYRIWYCSICICISFH